MLRKHFSCRKIGEREGLVSSTNQHGSGSDLGCFTSSLHRNDHKKYCAWEDSTMNRAWYRPICSLAAGVMKWVALLQWCHSDIDSSPWRFNSSLVPCVFFFFFFLLFMFLLYCCLLFSKLFIVFLLCFLFFSSLFLL